MKKHLKLIFLCVSMLFALTMAFGCEISFPNGGTSGGTSWGYGSDTMESKLSHEHYFERQPYDEYLKSPATCTKRAVYYYSCYECGEQSEKTFEYGDYAPHTIVVDEAVEPTCTKSGLTEGEHCEECNEIFIKQEEIPALGHDIINYEGKPATCTETGLTGLTEGQECSVCGEILIEQKEIDKLPHTEEILPAVTATCLDTGLTEGKKCSVCGEILIEQDVIKALGHNYGDWIIDKSATCTTSGSKHKVCSRCDDKQTQTLYAFGHNYGSWVTESQATCTTSGNKYRICSRCGFRSNQTIEKLGHNYGEWRVRKSATCTTTGINYRVCTRSGCYDEVTTETPALGHNYVDGICSRCGEADPSAETYTISGDYIYFGNYPQTQVTNSSIISTLNSMAGALPSDSNNQNWTSYGYYMSGSNSTAYMWYQDISYNGEKYRGVYFTKYRPKSWDKKATADNSCQDNNGYNLSTVYWFKFEKIKWKILTKSGNKAFLLYEEAIDSQAYQNTCVYNKGNSYRDNYFNNDPGVPSGTFANNYKYSTIRKWLNGTFYNATFNNLQKSLIATTMVDNSAESTLRSNNNHACANTYDKIFLMSAKELTNSDYGFYKEALVYGSDSNRVKTSTDYAKIQGCSHIKSNYIGKCLWWQRSPCWSSDTSYDMSYLARYVFRNGDVNYVENYYTNPVYYNTFGVVPALWINL